MGFIDDLIAQGQTLWQRVSVKAERNVVKADRYDNDVWEDLRVDVPPIDRQIRELNQNYDYTEESHADLFQMLHQGDPLLRRKDQMDERFKPNHALVSGFKDQTTTAALRTFTMHDELASAMALISMRTSIEDAYKRLRAASEKAKEAAEKRQQAREALAQLLPGVFGEPGEDDGGDDDGNGTVEVPVVGPAQGPMTEEEMQEAMDAAAALVADASTLDDEAQAQADLAADELAGGAEQALNELEEEEQLFRAFGVEEGELKRMSYEERLALARQLRSNRLAEFAKQFGQFRNIASAPRRRRVKDRPEEVVNVTLGDHLERLTPTELTNMVMPETEDRFLKDYSEKQLMEWEMEGVDTLGRGPVIVVCDESGSMDNRMTGGGTRESWSKALALGLCDIARRDHRDFIYIGFSAASQVWRCDFPDGKGPVAKVIEFTEHFYGGGTSYEPPLTLAKTIVLDYAARRLAKPDICFITDDEYSGISDSFIEDWQRTIEQTGMNVFGVQLGASTDEPTSMLRALSTDVRMLSDIKPGTDEAAELFRRI